MQQDLATMIADQPPLADGLKATRGGPSVLRVICVAIALSYNRGCTIAQWLRKSLLFERSY
jgi:hypothetical protein